MKPSLVILAGGKGTRLGDLTKETPKPMVEVCGKPFLYWLIKHYIAQGFEDITISTGYKSNVIKEHAYYNWVWELFYHQDTCPNSYLNFYNAEYNADRWVVNGDTFIPDPLPTTKEPTILVCGDIDAGAQYVANGKIKVQKVSSFYDIGTPEGLERFRVYAMTHLVNK